MNIKTQTKLELIRIEGIWRMLLKKITDETQLKNWVDNVTNTSTKDVKQTLKRLSRHQLIKVIELSGIITDEDVDDAYEQYRYGHKPGFTLFGTQSSAIKNDDEILGEISLQLSKIQYPEGANIKSIASKGYSPIDSSVVEFAFSYHVKYSYLSEKEEPAFIYEHKDCFAWVDKAGGFLVIQNVHDKVTTHLKNAFAKAFLANIMGIKLTQKLISEVFGNEQTKKATFINPNASDTQIEKMTLADTRFAKKDVIQQAVSGCEMTGTFLGQNVGEDQFTTLGINCQKGKLYLTSNVSASVFREWSIGKIKEIIAYLNEKADYIDFDLFRAKNLTDLSLWNNYTKAKKSLIEKILYSVYVSYHNKQDSAEFQLLSDLYADMNGCFHKRLVAHCEHCDEPFVPICVCGGILSITRDMTITCRECGPTEEVQCDEGHRVELNGIDNIVLFPDSSLMGCVRETLKTAFGIILTGAFEISKNRVTIIHDKNGCIISPQDIPELESIATIQITDDERKELSKKLEGIKEKCRDSTSERCNNCGYNTQEICMMKLFITFSDYRPSPHNASEFGDVSFNVTVNNKQAKLVGIAKSSTKKTLTRSSAVGREITQQILTATHDNRIDLIAIISPDRFQDQLTEEFRYIARLTGKPMVILDDRYMIRQYKAFCKQKRNFACIGDGETGNETPMMERVECKLTVS